MALSLLPGMALSDDFEREEVGIPVEDTDLSDAPFEDVEVSDAPFEDTDLSDAPFEDTDLSGVPVEDTDLSDAPFEDVEVSDAPFEAEAESFEEAELFAAPVSLRVEPPTTQTVTQGAALDIRGLAVYAVDADGTEQAVTDYALSGLDTSKTGEKEVTVTYGGLTATFSVTVEAAPVEHYITGIAIFDKRNLKRTYTQGEPLDTKGTLETTGTIGLENVNVTVYRYRAAPETIKGAQCAVTGYNPNQLGVQTLTVSYGGKSTEILVKVVPGSGQSTQTDVPALEAPRITIESVQGGKKVRFTRDGSMDSDFSSQYPGQMTKIYYTLDGSAPVPGAEGTFEYDNRGISIEETTTVKAVAILGNETSTVASGRVSVSQVQQPKPANEHHKNNQGPNRTMTQLEPGTLVSFLCDTAGASVYYWFDGQSGDADSHRYGSSVYIDRAYANDDGVVTLNAYATKDGYKNSGVMKLKYQLPKEEPPQEELVNISVGAARSRAGEAVSTSLSITTEESSGVTGFTITVRYDRRTFSFESVSPAETGGTQSEAVIPAGELFAAPDPSQGVVRIMYNGQSVTGGEMCMLNFRVSDSAEDSSGNTPYVLTVDGESARVSTSTGRPVKAETYDGSISLEGSHNSQLTAAILFSGEDNQEAADVNELSDSSNVTASISLDQESVQDYTNSLRDEDGNAPLTVMANAFVAFYDEDGNMLALETWEIDLSDLARLLFDRMMNMPEDAYDIKTMILSESLTPIMAAEEL